jgi:hypothetical protein
MTLDLSVLKRQLRKKGKEESSVWPSLTLTLYSNAALAELSPFAAILLRRYVEAIPKDVLRSALIREDFGPLTHQRFKRDIRRLEAPLKKDEGGRLIYSSSEFGPPGDYGCYFRILDLTDKELVGPLETNVMRFEFPWGLAEGSEIERVVSLFNMLAESVPFACGTAGFGFSYWREDRFAGDQVRAMLARYIAFDHSDVGANNLRERTPSPAWITFLSTDLVEKLGDISRVHQDCPNLQIYRLTHGLSLRAALRPPVGDINRGAEDIGCLPSVARWLKPLRFRASSFPGSQVEIDVPAWLQRFDLLENKPWRNRE